MRVKDFLIKKEFDGDKKVARMIVTLSDLFIRKVISLFI